MNILNYIPSAILQFAKPQYFTQSNNQATLRKVSAIAALNLALAPVIAFILAKARQIDAESSRESLSLETCSSWGANLFAPLATSLAKAGGFVVQGVSSLLDGNSLEGATLALGGYLSACPHELYRWQNGLIRFGMKRICKTEIPANALFTTIESCGVSALNLAMTPLIGRTVKGARKMDAETGDVNKSKEALVLCASTVAAPLATAHAETHSPSSSLTTAVLIFASYIFTYVYPVHQHWQSSLVDRILKKVG